MTDISNLYKDARQIRKSIINLAFSSSGGQHLGGGLSMVDIMTTLYGSVINNCSNSTADPLRDRFILSKGHGVLGFYPVLHHYGYISDEIYNTYKTPGTQLISHPIKNLEYGIESSNGSLGHGLSYAAGIAFGLKQSNLSSKVYVLVGDGECNEGSIWEAAMSASQLQLSNLTCIVDCNKYQSDGHTDDIQSVVSMQLRWNSFGWHVIEVDGHDISQLLDAFSIKTIKPKLILANTIKGKGISFMENDNSWHHGRLTSSTFEQAIAELS